VRRLLIIIFACFLHWPGHAEKQGQALIDSLVKELPNAKTDTGKILLINRISFLYNTIDAYKGIEYAKQGINLSEKASWKKGLAHANNNMGSNYTTLSEYPKALHYFFEALKYFEEIDNKSGIGIASGNIGLIYYNEGSLDKAKEYYNKALGIFRAKGDKYSIAINTGNLGNLYNDQNKYDEALPYYTEALALYRDKDVNDKSGEALILGNIGNVYAGKKDYTTALDYYDKALKLNLELEDKYGMSLNYYTRALAFVNMSKDSSKGTKKMYMERAIDDLSKAISIDSALGYLDGVQSKSDELSEVYARYGDYRKALEFHRLFTKVKDSIYSKEKAATIEELQTKREVELKNKQIELDKLAVKKKRNERVYFLGGISLLLLLCGIVFRNYKVVGAEKKKSEELLLNILPTEVANELKNRGATTAKHFDDVTVLFTDFVNFTRAGERMGTQKLVEELHNCFKAFDNIISKHNVEKIKTIGDAYLAVGGLPVATKEHAVNIVNAALEIRAFMLQRQKELGEDTFEVRIGCHSGSVVAGIVGVKKFAYDIWGDTVNTAARMEQHGASGKINISQNTYELVKDKFTCSYRGEIEAKNKGMMKMYFVEDTSF